MSTVSSTSDVQKKMKNSTQALISSANQSFKEATHDLGEQVGSTISDFSERASTTYARGREYVKENPVKGVAIAALAGVVAGGLISRISSH